MGSGCTKKGSWDANWTWVTVHEEAVCGTATRGLEDGLRTEGVLMGELVRELRGLVRAGTIGVNVVAAV